MKQAKNEEFSSTTSYLPQDIKLATLGSRIAAILIDCTIFFILLIFSDLVFFDINDDVISIIGFLGYITWITHPFFLPLF